jgi:hypothetical protein
MVYLKAVVVGIVAAVVAAGLWIVVPILLTFLVSMRGSIATTASGGIGAGDFMFSVVVPTGTSTLVAALIGFVMGGGWYLRRARRATA